MLDRPAPGDGARRPDAGPPLIDPAGRRRDLAGVLDAWLAWHAADPRWFRLHAEFLLSVRDLSQLRDDVVLRRRRVRARLAHWLVALAEQRGRRLTVPPEELALHIDGVALGPRCGASARAIPSGASWWPDVGAGAAELLDDLTVTRDGTVFVAARGSGNVHRVDAATGATCEIASNLPQVTAVEPGGGHGFRRSHLYVSSFTGTVYELTPH